MPKFEGCVEAKEISLCPKSLGGGANPHAHVLVLKTLAGGKPTERKTEKTMSGAAAPSTADVTKAALAVANKIASMNDVTKAHYLALGEDEQLAFLEKSSEEQATVAKEAKDAADKKKMEDEAAKAGTTAEVVELRKTNATLTEQVEKLLAKDAERDLEKRADTEFAGYPGGSAAVVPLLKAYAKLPDDVRKASEELLKKQCQAAAVVTRSFGAATEADVSKAAAAQQRIEAAAEKYATDHKVSKAVALEKVSEMREYADDVAAIAG